MSKEEKLKLIAEAIEACEICKVGKSGKAVPGEGNPDADIVFIGEAPGKQEALSGRPFIGRSGKFLRSQIQEIGLKEADIYITSPVKYLPDRGTPTPADIAHGRIHLMKQFDVIEPKIIVLMGNTAAQGVLEEKVPVMSRHGTTLEKDGKKYFLTLHPAAAIRFLKFRKIFQEDFQKLKQLL
jgi:uracil-DNA glycosylase